MNPDPGNPADVLRDAAEKLRKMAFGFSAEHFWQKDITRAVTEGSFSLGSSDWARAMGPDKAKPLAAWLESQALLADQPHPWGAEADEYAIDFARLILGETPTN